MNENDLLSVQITIQVALTSTAILLVLGTALAWWLATTRSRLRPAVNALVALPLVLPPTVVGFYLLLLTGPAGPIGKWTQWFGLGVLPFTFWGLVVGSVIYSMPFVVQPLQNAFEAVGSHLLEVAATLGAGPWARFFKVALPMVKPSLVTAAVLGFAHSLGEFGVVLMMGGNIPGSTRVLSVAIYDHVESLEYGRAHQLAGGLLAVSYLCLWIIFSRGRRNSLIVGA